MMLTKTVHYWTQFAPIETYWHYINAISLLLIGFFSFILNAMVMCYLFKYFFVLFSTQHLFIITKYFVFNRIKHLKRPGTHFLINLTLVDILKSTFNLPMSILSSFNEAWMFGNAGKYFNILS